MPKRIALALLLLAGPRSGLAAQEFSEPDRPSDERKDAKGTKERKKATDSYRLAFYGVTTKGAMSRWRASAALRRHRDDSLAGCRLPRTTARSLAGRIKVEAVIGKTGRLEVRSIHGLGQHERLAPCLRRRMMGWKLTDRKTDQGTEIRFTAYVTHRVTSRASGVLGVLARRGTLSSAILGASGGLGTRTSGPGAGTAGIGGLVGIQGRGARTATMQPSGGIGRLTGSYYRSRPKVEGLKSSGALSPNVVRWAFKVLRLASNTGYCHTSAARQDPAIAGAIHVTLRVGKAGTVDKVEVTRATITDAKMRSCVMGRVMRMDFPEADGPTEISFRLTFPKAEKRSY